jgi:hypothetical protein
LSVKVITLRFDEVRGGYDDAVLISGRVYSRV